jgi:hypothetical protein
MKVDFKQLWGKTLVLKSRASVYYGIVSMLMLLRVFLTTFDDPSLGWGLFVLGLIGLVAITIYDYLFIYGRESEITWTKNRITNEMAKRIERVETKIDKLLEEKNEL